MVTTIAGQHKHTHMGVHTQAHMGTHMTHTKTQTHMCTHVVRYVREKGRYVELKYILGQKIGKPEARKNRLVAPWTPSKIKSFLIYSNCLYQFIPEVRKSLSDLTLCQILSGQALSVRKQNNFQTGIWPLLCCLEPFTGFSLLRSAKLRHVSTQLLYQVDCAKCDEKLEGELRGWRNSF